MICLHLLRSAERASRVSNALADYEPIRYYHSATTRRDNGISYSIRGASIRGDSPIGWDSRPVGILLVSLRQEGWRSGRIHSRHQRSARFRSEHDNNGMTLPPPEEYPLLREQLRDRTSAFAAEVRVVLALKPDE